MAHPRTGRAVRARCGCSASAVVQPVRSFPAPGRDAEAGRCAELRRAIASTGSGCLASSALVCELDNWGAADAGCRNAFVDAYGDALLEHLDKSLLPLLWNGVDESSTAETADLASFTVAPAGRSCCPSPGWPFRCGSARSAMATSSSPRTISISSSDMIVELHGRSCQIMMDLLALDETPLAGRRSAERARDRLPAAGRRRPDQRRNRREAGALGAHRQRLSRLRDDQARFASTASRRSPRRSGSATSADRSATAAKAAPAAQIKSLGMQRVGSLRRPSTI